MEDEKKKPEVADPEGTDPKGGGEPEITMEDLAARFDNFAGILSGVVERLDKIESDKAADGKPDDDKPDGDQPTIDDDEIESQLDLG